MLLENIYRSLRPDFAQKVKAVVDELEQWTEEELFLQRCHELSKDKKALSAYVDSFEPDFLKKIFYSQKFLEQDKHEVRLTEDMFFPGPDSTNRNVTLRKHKRYTPKFNHKHELFQIGFVLRGQHIDTIADKQVVLPAGSLYFIPPETIHSTDVTEDSLVVYIMIKRSTFDEVFIKLLTASDILSRFFMRNIYNKGKEFLVFNIGNDIELLELFFSMLVEQSINDKETSRIMENQLSIFFSMINRKYGKNPIVHEQLNVDENLWEIITYINEHFRTITRAKLAAHFGLSAAHCSRLIKSITGKTFTVLLQDLRMNHARSMLSQSGMKIYDISYSLGYENQEVFIRSFKKVHGISPVQYRKNYPY